MKSKRVSARSGGVLICMLVFVAGISNAANFSGKYVSKSSHSTDASLEVGQTDAAIEFTRIEGDKTTKGSCPFSGSNGHYISSGGAPGECKAEFKGKDLVIEATIITHPAGSAQPMRVQILERWQLSSDTKTLTIKSKANFPDAAPEIGAAISGDTSYTEKFTRML